MIEFIKTIIISIISGLTMPLTASSSAHLSVLSNILNFTTDKNILSLYSAVFSMVFSLIIFVNFRNIYAKGFISLTIRDAKELKRRKLSSYRKYSENLLLSLIPIFILFIPVEKNKLVIDFFGDFMLSNNLALISGASIVSGLILFVGFWYAKQKKTKTLNVAKYSDAFRFGIYQMPSYIIPGLSHVSCGATSLVIADVKDNVIMREIYFYLAPQLFIISVFKLIRALTTSIALDPMFLILAAIIFALFASITVHISLKANLKKVTMLFAGYSIVFGIYVAISAIVL